MLNFQPAGFEQLTLVTPLGKMVYSVPAASFWGNASSDKEPLVFLHSLGGGSSSYEWSKVFPAFASSYRVIAPDLIGWGDSSHPIINHTPQTYLEQIQILLQQVAGSPAWVVASSLTAALTIRLAIEQPSLFRGLFLVCPSGYRDFGTGYERDLAGQLLGFPGIDWLIYTLGAANELAVRNFLEQFLFANPERLSQEIIAAYLASAVKPNGEYAALASLKGDICFDLSVYVGQLKIPTAFVWGEKSRFSSPQQGRRLAQLNSEAVNSFYSIPDAGVLPHLEVPAIVTGLLAQFLKIE